MNRNIASLPVGYKFTTGRRTINTSEIKDYVEAVGGYGSASDDPQAVPPTAISAYALREILNEISLPGGAVHAGQNISMLRSVSVGDSVLFEARLSQNSVRSGWRYLAIDYQVYDATSNTELMEGRSTIVIPEIQVED